MSISVQGISKNFKGRRKGEPDNQVLKDVSFEGIIKRFCIFT